jgi:hypothetical protein
MPSTCCSRCSWRRWAASPTSGGEPCRSGRSCSSWPSRWRC